VNATLALIALLLIVALASVAQVMTDRPAEPAVVNHGNTPSQDAAFQEVRRLFGMRATALPPQRRAGEPLQLFARDGSILIPDAPLCCAGKSAVASVGVTP